jgi:hypothetical protein
MISQDHIGPGLQGGSLASSGVVYPPTLESALARR